MYLKTAREHKKFVISYDLGGSPDRFPKETRKRFAFELQYRLKKIDSTIPMYENKMWRPRRCRLQLPAGEIILRRKKDIEKAIAVLKTLRAEQLY